jgi:hypothetical protein
MLHHVHYSTLGSIDTARLAAGIGSCDELTRQAACVNERPAVMPTPAPMAAASLTRWQASNQTQQTSSSLLANF